MLILAHEFGHVIDGYAGEIPIKGLEDELKSLYHYTATKRRYNPALDELVTPENFGYRNIGKDKWADKEYVAEAIRSYLVDPNTFKSIAPETASRIRDMVNRNHEISRVIHFNSLPLVLGGGAAGYGVMMGAGGTENASAETLNRPRLQRPDAEALDLRRALMEQGGY